MWKSDGTEAGTVLVKEIVTDDFGEFSSLTAVGNLLFFRVRGFTNNTIDLWRSDGTATGTFPVKSSMALEPQELTAVNSLLFFTLDGDLWQGDGTPTGTVVVQDFTPESNALPAELTAFKNLLYFIARRTPAGNSELWQSDGTPAGTRPVNEQEIPEQGSVVQLTVVNDLLYFVAYESPQIGSELWQSNGLAGGAALVKDINPGNGSSAPMHLTGGNQALYLRLMMVKPAARSGPCPRLLMWMCSNLAPARIASRKTRAAQLSLLPAAAMSKRR